MPYYMHDLTPDYASAIGLFQHLTKEELQDLVNSDDSRITELVNDLEQVKNLKNDKEVWLSSNKSTADANLAKEAQLVESRKRLLELCSNVTELKTESEELRQRLSSLGATTSLEATLAILQAAAAEAETESEKIADDFLEGQKGPEVFVDEFVPKRTLAHLRRVKAEKMTELLRNPQAMTSGNGPQVTPRRPAPPPPAYWNPNPPMRMPLPFS